MINVTASIVLYNENKDVLNKLLMSMSQLDIQTTVVDNSPSSLLSSICESFEFVTYIFNGKNIGFGAAHNLAFKNKTVQSDIHLIINPDVYFDKEVMLQFLEWFANENTVSLAVPQVLNEDATLQHIVREIPTPMSLLKRKFGVDSGEIDIQSNLISEIPFSHGCFIAIKSDVYQSIGGFDERFFLYMEDVDLFIKAKEYGKTVINTNYSIYHGWERGSSKSMKLLSFHIASAIKFFWKYR
jgi:GT2 family glycosyltransferase